MNYDKLFLATLPITMLEAAALLVLVVDLAFLRRASLALRNTSAVLLGLSGCVAGLWALLWAPAEKAVWGYSLPGSHELLLNNMFFSGAAQSGILLLTALTMLFLVGSSFTRHVGEYVAVVLMAAAGGLIISAAQDLLVIFIGLELLSLCLYILTAFQKSSARATEAALKYYLFGGMSAAFLLFGFSYFYGLGGSTNLAVIQSTIAHNGPSPMLYVAWVLVATGLGFKVAAVPFHLWAPDTYEGAPAPAVAFIASVSKVASFSLLLTLATNWIQASYCSMTANPHEGMMHGSMGSMDMSGGMAGCVCPPMRIPSQFVLVLVAMAALSMVIGNLAALAQTSVRRLLAYSAIAHAGYILVGIAYTSPDAVTYYALTYGLTSIGSFGVVSVVEQATGSDRLDSFLGLSKKNPLIASILLVLLLSLAGIPPLVGFWSKFNLFAAVLKLNAGVLPFALIAVAIAMSAVSLYYYLQVLKAAWVSPAADDRPVKAGVLNTLVLMVIALAVLALGCFPAALEGWIRSFYPMM